MADAAPRRTIQLFAPLIGRWPGRIPDVFERLGPLLAEAGHRVDAVSTHRGSLRRSLQLVATAARVRPDVAVVHLYSGRAAYVEDVVAMLQRRRAGRLVGVLSGGGFPAFERRRPAATRRLLGRFDELVAPSSYLAGWAEELLGRPVTVIANPLDVDDYPFRQRTEVRPRLLWMRAYHEVYAPEVAVAVVDRLRTELPAVHLTMAGPDKGRRAAVEAEVARRGLQDQVDVRGFVTADEKARLFVDCDVFLNTPIVDNRPVSLVEAGASGMCIVSTDAGGVPHLVEDGVDALLAPVGDVDALADAIVRLCRDPELAARLSSNARALADAGDPPHVLAAWEAVLAKG